MSLPPRFRIRESVLSRIVGTETIIFDTRSSSYYSLNEVGGRFWTLVQEQKETGEILFMLIDEFEVDRSRLEGDIASLTTQLQSLGLLEKIEEAA